MGNFRDRIFTKGERIRFKSYNAGGMFVAIGHIISYNPEEKKIIVEPNQEYNNILPEETEIYNLDVIEVIN